jgi:hypothetical protein
VEVALLTAEDRIAIAETIAMHGHLFDEGELDRLDELFTSDVTYDVSDVGLGVLHGIDAVRQAALDLGSGNPVAHHVTNIVITDTDGQSAAVRSKGIAVMSDRRCVACTYVDTVRNEPDGWRISHRKILPRREPLGGAGSTES